MGSVWLMGCCWPTPVSEHPFENSCQALRLYPYALDCGVWIGSAREAVPRSPAVCVSLFFASWLYLLDRGSLWTVCAKAPFFLIFPSMHDYYLPEERMQDSKNRKMNTWVFGENGEWLAFLQCSLLYVCFPPPGSSETLWTSFCSSSLRWFLSWVFLDTWSSWSSSNGAPSVSLCPGEPRASLSTSSTCSYSTTRTLRMYLCTNIRYFWAFFFFHAFWLCQISPALGFCRE